jgi:hypothetical protein
VPDVNYCGEGSEGWIELKKTDGWVVNVSPHQVAWMERRMRAGGRVFIMVRRKGDELWLLPGSAARGLASKKETLRTLSAIAKFEGGPRAWDWTQISALLRGPPRIAIA